MPVFEKQSSQLKKWGQDIGGKRLEFLLWDPSCQGMVCELTKDYTNAMFDLLDLYKKNRLTGCGTDFEKLEQAANRFFSLLFLVGDLMEQTQNAAKARMPNLLEIVSPV